MSVCDNVKNPREEYFICLVCDNVKNPREEYLRTIYSNGKRQWRVIVIKKKKRKKEKKVMQPHKPVTSLDKCRVAFYWVTLYLL
jgi:hypothetical protein